MTNPSTISKQGRGYRVAARVVLTTATAAAFIGLASVSASAAPGAPATDSVVARVEVNSTITLALDQDDFTLTGDPGDTATGVGAVTGTVTTNSGTGYNVSVLGATPTLAAGRTGNTDSIPIGDLKVHNAADVYTSLSTTVPVITATAASRTDGDGDGFSDDYQVVIPNINSDTYSATLNYTATALA